jgi:hypothetical protein
MTRRCPLMAQLGPAEMSAIRSLLGDNRTTRPSLPLLQSRDLTGAQLEQTGADCRPCEAAPVSVSPLGETDWSTGANAGFQVERLDWSRTGATHPLNHPTRRAAASFACSLCYPGTDLIPHWLCRHCPFHGIDPIPLIAPTWGLSFNQLTGATAVETHAYWPAVGHAG